MMRPVIWRLLALFRRRRLDAMLDEEIRAHLDMLTAEYERRGASPQDARLAARRSFGGVEAMKERYRDRSGIPWLAAIGRDVRFASRLLVKDRWFTAGVVAALSVGIAANAIVFTLVNGILLRDLPFADPERIVAIETRSGQAPAGVSYLDFLDWRDASRTVDLGAATETTMNVADEGRPPERFIGAYLSANTFALLGQAPVLGRTFLATDDGPGAEPVVMLGHSVWRTRYAADSGIIGRTIRVNGVASTVIGVMPEEFGFPVRSHVWQPLAMLPPETRDARAARVLSGFGRLAADTTIAQATAELRGIAASLAQRHPLSNAQVEPVIGQFGARARGGSRQQTALQLLMVLVGFVLLIACANAANLQLAKAASRTREIAVRLGVGATRADIVRQLLAESALLAAIAGAIGLGATIAGIRLFRTVVAGFEGGLPFWIGFPMDWKVFTFLTAICLGTAFVFGIVPAMQMSSVGAAGSPVESGAIAGSVRRRRLATALVMGQLALTPVLLTGGGLMMRSMLEQQKIDPGVRTSGLVRMRLDLVGPKYPSSAERARFYREIEDRLADSGLPAALASHAPFEGAGIRRLVLDRRSTADRRADPIVRLMTIGGDYFGVFGTRLVRGGPLVPPADGGANPALVNERFAEQYFDGADPIGRAIVVGLPGQDSPTQQFTVVGVAPYIRQRSTESGSAIDPIIYVGYSSSPQAGASVIVKSDAAPAAVASVVRQHVGAIDPDLALYGVMTVDESLAGSDERTGLRLFGTIFIALAAIALMLATLGLYGVTAYTASQRTREIGIRIAIGAAPRQVGWLVTSRACRQVMAGLSIGMAGAVGVGRLLRGILIGISGMDFMTLGGVALLLAGVAFVASYMPARRAMRVDPVAALRVE